MKHKKLLTLVLAAAVIASLTVSGCAKPVTPPAPPEYPARPITLICGSSPGGGSDTLARNVAITGEKYFGVPISVLTKKGGGGGIALAYLHEQPADGYHMDIVTLSQILGIAGGAIPFNADDFKYLIRIQGEPYGLVTQPDSPFDNIKEFIDYAKEHPGELTVGGYGTATAASITFLQLMKEAGNPDVRWIAYDGSDEALTAMLGGHVDCAQEHVSGGAEYLRAGQLKFLGLAGEERAKVMPDVPTFRELGYDVVVIQIRGLVTHGDVPDDVAEAMKGFLKQTIHDPDFEEYMAGVGLEYMDTFATATESTEWFVSQVELYKTLLAEAGFI